MGINDPKPMTLYTGMSQISLSLQLHVADVFQYVVLGNYNVLCQVPHLQDLSLPAAAELAKERLRVTDVTT